MPKCIRCGFEEMPLKGWMVFTHSRHNTSIVCTPIVAVGEQEIHASRSSLVHLPPDGGMFYFLGLCDRCQMTDQQKKNNHRIR